MSSEAKKERPRYVAHTPREGTDEWQSMEGHVVGDERTPGVAPLAEAFAGAFGAAEWGRWAGLLHDIGKYSDEFRDYLIACDRAKREGTPPPRPGSAEHKRAGTKLAFELFPSGPKQLLSAIVLGHHGGLRDKSDVEIAIALAEEERQDLDICIRRAREDLPELNATPPHPENLISLTGNSTSSAELWRRLEMLTRFLFSCLVDADSLDTESHLSPEKAGLRPTLALKDVLEEWWGKFIADQDRLQEGKEDSPVNRVRRETYEACINAGEELPGVFSLTVPTGGGKTRSSLAFALAHVRQHVKSDHWRSRIIYAAPYTSIIDQNAQEYRDILGAEGIVEHHSAIEVRDEKGEDVNDEAAQAEVSRERQRRLASENWQAPFIVTTTVQLLESLFSNRTSRCRKLHNIARSIIILDEVQTLPPALLTPLLEGLKLLVELFGVTLVLCTATQPAIIGDTPFLKGLPLPHPIIPDPEPHFSALSRVRYRVESEAWDWEKTASEMVKKEVSVLTVLNTKKDSLALLDNMKEKDIYHLSTLLCMEHRRNVLNRVKTALGEERLRGGPPVYLISTQVIEAGVDIDFPCVFRAKGPLDRIIQAAGRCNREGLREREDSEVVVFEPSEGSAPTGEYRTALAIAWAEIKGRDFQFDKPEAVTAYFAKLYRTLGERYLDRDGVQEDRKKWLFPCVAEKVRLIKDDTVPVLAPYHQGLFEEAKLTQAEFEGIVGEIRDRERQGWGMNRDLWQRIQPITVSIYRHEAEKLLSSILDWLVPDQLGIWPDHSYDRTLGIGRSVIYDPSDLIN